LGNGPLCRVDADLKAPTLGRAAGDLAFEILQRKLQSTAPKNGRYIKKQQAGDRRYPTDKLHLGHLVGSLENRLRLQSEYECFFIIANKHAFVTRAQQPEDIRRSVIDVATDWLAAGIDPNRSAMFIQSEVPVIDELMFYFAMLLPLNRVMRNPTLKDELRDKGLGDSYPFGFPLYAVGQVADILAFRPELVQPLGSVRDHSELGKRALEF
jgi:tryptophanyl-tRNA synthetase